jgi:hypothetical protein
MGDFLDAECVINVLFEKGVFTKKLWKLDKVSASSYDVSFELADSARIAGFTIFIRGTYPCGSGAWRPSLYRPRLLRPRVSDISFATKSIISSLICSTRRALPLIDPL